VVPGIIHYKGRWLWNGTADLFHDAIGEKGWTPGTQHICGSWRSLTANYMRTSTTDFIKWWCLRTWYSSYCCLNKTIHKMVGNTHKQVHSLKSLQIPTNGIFNRRIKCHK
jgi:hypothetical protein